MQQGTLSVISHKVRFVQPRCDARVIRQAPSHRTQKVIIECYQSHPPRGHHPRESGTEKRVAARQAAPSVQRESNGTGKADRRGKADSSLEETRERERRRGVGRRGARLVSSSMDRHKRSEADGWGRGPCGGHATTVHPERPRQRDEEARSTPRSSSGS